MERRVPQKPLLKPWYRLARAGDRLALEYGQTVVSLEGKAVSRLLPVLLPLLDGTRTAEEIAAYLGEPVAPAVRRALAVLAEHGVVTEGPPLPRDAPRPIAQTVESLAAASASERPIADAWDSLRRAEVAIVGSGSLAEELARLLRLSGVAEIRRGEWPAAEALESAELALAAPRPDELPRLEQWNRLALRAGSPWLQVLPFDGRCAVIGPLFVPGETCCHECYRLRRASNVSYPEEFWALERQPAPYPASPPLERAVAGLAALLALRWLVHRDPFLPGAFYALEQDATLALTFHHVYRVPRCPVCSGAAGLAPPSPWHQEELRDRG